MKIRYIIDIDVEYDYENLTELQFKLKDELEEYVKDSELGYYADKTSVKLQDDYCIKEEKRLLKAGRNTLELIKRQKAEIKRLNIELQSMRSAANSYKMHYETAKSEAIKEFAERLKSKRQWDTEFENMIVFDTDIDNLVKEMTE